MYQAIKELYEDELICWDISPKDTDYAAQRQAVDTIMVKLGGAFSPEQAHLLEDLVFEVCIQLGMDHRDAFVQGFRAGVRLTTESLL